MRRSAADGIERQLRGRLDDPQPRRVPDRHERSGVRVHPVGGAARGRRQRVLHVGFRARARLPGAPVGDATRADDRGRAVTGHRAGGSRLDHRVRGGRARRRARRRGRSGAQRDRDERGRTGLRHGVPLRSAGAERVQPQLPRRADHRQRCGQQDRRPRQGVPLQPGRGRSGRRHQRVLPGDIAAVAAAARAADGHPCRVHDRRWPGAGDRPAGCGLDHRAHGHRSRRRAGDGLSGVAQRHGHGHRRSRLPHRLPVRHHAADRVERQLHGRPDDPQLRARQHRRRRQGLHLHPDRHRHHRRRQRRLQPTPAGAATGLTVDLGERNRVRTRFRSPKTGIDGCLR
ncbi:MAG: hypothetical protein JWM34_926 [Ilumatobacteraceae bacterium]|nr:hypothetical protein [Ilumatobacteraceae bacterium]